MSSNLGSMVIQLAANTAQLQSDLGRAGKLAQDYADKATSALKSVGAAIGVGIGVGAFKEFIAGAIETQDQALKLSQKIGVATESMAGLSSAAQKAGVDQGGFQAAMVKLSKSAADAANGVKQQAAEYSALGIKVKDASGAIKGSDVLLGELADKFKGYKDGVEKTALAVAIFGKAGADMIPLLNGGSAAIQHQIKLTQDLGVAFTKSAAESAERFNDTMSDLSLVSKGLGNTIATALLPALNKLADDAMRFFTSDTWKTWLANISAAFTAVANHIDDIVAGVKLLGEIAAEYIGFRFVTAVTQATARLAAMTIATLAANSAAAEMGLSFGIGVGASLKQIGYLNAALGTVFAGVSGWQIGTYLYNQFKVVQVIANNMMASFDAAWTFISSTAKIAWLEIEKAFYSVIDAVQGALSDSLAKMAANFAKLPDALGGAKLSAQFLALSTAIAPSVDHVEELNDRITTLRDEADRDLKIAGRSWGEYTGATTAAAAATNAAGDAANNAAPNVANLGAKTDIATAAAEKLAEMFAKDAQIIAGLAGKIDPVQAKYAEFAKSVLAAAAAYNAEIVQAQKLADGTDELAQAKANLAIKLKGSSDALASELNQLVKQNDIVGKLFDNLNAQSAVVGLTEREREQADAVAECVKAWNELNPAIRAAEIAAGKIDPTTAAGTRAIRAQIGALHDQKQAAELAAESAKGWQSIWANAANSVADTFAKVVVEGGNLFDSLKNIAKQTVEQIIAYFVKLAVINPILNSIFGGQAGYSMMPSLGGMATQAISGGGGFSGGGGSGPTGGGATSLFSPSSWTTAGQNLYSGFQSAGTMAGNAWANMTGATTYSGPVMTGPPVQYAGAGNPAFAGSYASGSVGSPSYGGYSSGLGQAVGIAGGIYAGYSAYKNAGGGTAGIAAGAAYGVGTYFAGAAVSTALAGGLAAGLAAIPVVGWIAIAAMLIDKFSGGKLFGTAWSTKSATTSLAIGPEGGDATAFLSQTKQGALFSGKQYRDKSVAAGAEAQTAAQGLFDAVKQTMVTAAHQLTIDVPPVIQAALDIVNTFDKKGKVTSTKYIVDILGKKYEEASQELAATRIAAESIVATIAASEAGKAASTIAEQWRSSAETLMDGAQFLLAATVDINKGKNLLGTGGTLTDIADVITGLQQGNEKLLETYARVVAENDLMKQALALTGVNIGKTGAEFVKFADAVANAAGGIDQLNQLVQTFNQAYFSAAEIAAQAVKTLQDASNLALTGIGEDPLESMEKFKADFLASLPSLTPEQLASWYQAGVALANYTKAVTDSANQVGAAKQNYAAFEMKLFGKDFVSAFASVVQAEQQQIDQANALAKAAGLAGASQQDLNAIMTQGSYAIGRALADLANGIQADINTIYGAKTVADDPAGMFVVQNTKAAKDAAAQQQQNQAIGAAYDLIQKLGTFAFASGKSMEDVFAQFGQSPAQLAAVLGISADQVKDDFNLAKDQAASLTTMAAQGAEQIGISKDILAAIQGKPLPYDLSALVAPPVASAAPGKIGNGNTAPAPVIAGLSFNAPDTPGTRQVVDATKDIGTKIVEAVNDLHQFLRGGPGQTILRNQRFATPVRVA